MCSIFKKYFVALILFVSLLLTYKNSVAQCAMCSLNAENGTIEGNMQGAGLNNGIYFLLAMPFLIGLGVGIIWYKYYRKSTKSSNPFLQK